jgi:hypothetical protein
VIKGYWLVGVARAGEMSETNVKALFLKTMFLMRSNVYALPSVTSWRATNVLSKTYRFSTKLLGAVDVGLIETFTIWFIWLLLMGVLPTTTSDEPGYSVNVVVEVVVSETRLCSGTA